MTPFERNWTRRGLLALGATTLFTRSSSFAAELIKTPRVTMLFDKAPAD